MRTVRITAGPFQLLARLEEADAPRTCAAVRAMLPLRKKLLHCRWTGESTWVPMGDERVPIEPENHTSHLYPGQVLLYPGGFSEGEFLLPYGGALFASRVGQLAANHFATVIEGAEHLAEVGRLTLWEGAQDFAIEDA